MKHIIFKIILLCTIVSTSSSADSASKLVSYSIPENRELKKAFGYDEDTYFNFTELTSKYKYPTEEHEVTTDDGYILKMFRILPKCERETREFPVFLMHGIIDTSDSWIVSGQETGFGYILANNCYDVWAGNHRGNGYSRRHIKLDPNKDVDYWNFSFDEHGNYDLPAMINYILKTTQKTQVNYIGHSQGTTNFFVMNSLRPEYNDKIRVALLLGPVAWMSNIRSPIARIAASGTDFIKQIVDMIGLRELFAKHQMIHSILEVLCQIAPENICGTLLFSTTGYVKGTIQSRTISVGFGHVINGISAKNLAHYGQLVVSQNFQRYDEGRKGNFLRYNSAKPPQYNVSRVNSSVVFICAKNDWISSLKDVAKLSVKLPNVLENYVVPEPYWSHHNHLWGIKAPNVTFPKILDYLNRFNGQQLGVVR